MYYSAVSADYLQSVCKFRMDVNIPSTRMRDSARYSILKDSEQLYAAKYLTYLPTKEEFTAEIERQKEIFALQAGKYQA